MANVKVFNMNGQPVSDLELNDAVFGIEPNTVVMHAAVVNYLANQRQGTQSTLTRTEVSGGGKKPWRQKGTGHARQGSTRAPQWYHGLYPSVSRASCRRRLLLRESGLTVYPDAGLQDT